MLMSSALYQTNTLIWIFSSLKLQYADRNVIPLRTHCPHSEPTILCPFSLNAVCLAEKQQLPILQYLPDRPDRGSNPQSTALEAITPPLDDRDGMQSVSVTSISWLVTFYKNKYLMRGTVWIHKNSLTHHFLLKCLYQARKVSGHVFVCQGYQDRKVSGHVFVC